MQVLRLEHLSNGHKVRPANVAIKQFMHSAMSTFGISASTVADDDEDDDDAIPVALEKLQCDNRRRGERGRGGKTGRDRQGVLRD